MKRRKKICFQTLSPLPTPSHLRQQMLRDQFNINLSIGYLNEVRAQLGVRYVRPQDEVVNGLKDRTQILG